MQCYAKLYPRKYHQQRAIGKLEKVKRLLLTGLPSEIVVLLIMAVVMPAAVMSSLKR